MSHYKVESKVRRVREKSHVRNIKKKKEIFLRKNNRKQNNCH